MSARAALPASICIAAAVTAVGVEVTAETSYFVDPDWSGAPNGTAAEPYQQLTQNAWDNINATLAGDDVVVFFSAREAGTEDDETTTDPIDIERTDSSTHRLTLDGQSQYNVNDTAPAWQSTSGYKLQVTARYPISTGPVSRSYVTIRGFRVLAGDDGIGGQIINYFGGSHVVIEDNDLAHHPNAGHGAGLQYGYAHHQNGGGNGGHESIVIRNNVIHDTFGECIYIGGSEDTGLPAHESITVDGNTTYNCGVLGGEGDCIDIKDGNVDVAIWNNHCWGNAPGGNVNGITSSSPITAERNVIHDTPGKGITFGTFWGNGYTGVLIANNIVFGNAKDGIYAGTDTAAKLINDVRIEHNTVVGNGGNGLVVGAGEAGAITNVAVVDNIVSGNGDAGLGGWGDLGACAAAHNDVHGNASDFAGPFGSCVDVTGNFSADPGFRDAADPAGPDQQFFTDDDGLKPIEGSVVCGAGQSGDDVGALPCGLIGTGGAGGGGTGGSGASAGSTGTPAPDEGSGCGCRTVGDPGAGSPWWATLALMLTASRRRRQPPPRRTRPTVSSRRP